MGCIRLGHVQRSEWVRITWRSLCFVCRRGKQPGQRQGFQWSCPRFTSQSQVDIGAWLMRAWTQNPAGPPPAIGFGPATRQELTAKAIVEASRVGVSAVVPPGELSMLITWGVLSELSGPQLVALGNWTGHQQDRSVSSMPLRYTGSKQRLSLILKHTFSAFLATVWDSKEKLDVWDSLTRDFCIKQLQSTWLSRKKLCCGRAPLVQQGWCRGILHCEFED